MANQEHLERLRQGVEGWNVWRVKNRVVQPDLIKADLSGANLSRANLIRANLIKADLSRANLSRAYLSGANLREASLSRANLRDTNLSGTNLIETNLIETNLSAADLRDADLSGAYLGRTILVENDLRTVKGLINIHHWEKSSIELFSIQLPQDGSALHFLRGCGVPDEWLEFWHATKQNPIQYHSCFISYNSADEMVARRFHADLQDAGVRCWFAPENLKIGDRLGPRINEAIHIQDKLLLILSEHSVQSSWVEHEVDTASKKEEREERDVLFPIRIDESIFETSQTWALLLCANRHIGDFTKWKDQDAYQIAFQRLLRDLKHEGRNNRQDETGTG